MSTQPTPATSVVGCLLDVSGSMRAALEAGRATPNEPGTERLRAVLRAALKVAQAEQRHDPGALVFVGAFGLRTDEGCPPTIDLVGAAADAILGDSGQPHASGHD